MKFQIKQLISGAETGGKLAAFEERTSPGAGPPRHAHANQIEVFHILKGRHLFLLNDQTLEAGPGECVVVPAGATHAFKNIDTEEGVLHFELLPAGSSGEFFDRLVRGDFSLEGLPEFFREYDIALLGPPL